MKEGIYAVYKGKEYRAALSPDLNDGNDIALIISEDPEDLNIGFERSIFGFSKKVPIRDLDSAYTITNYAFYKGCKLQITSKNEDGYVFYTNSYTIAQALEMEFDEPLVYHKFVNKADVEKECEERKYIWGFNA